MGDFCFYLLLMLFKIFLTLPPFALVECPGFCFLGAISNPFADFVGDVVSVMHHLDDVVGEVAQFFFYALGQRTEKAGHVLLVGPLLAQVFHF